MAQAISRSNAAVFLLAVVVMVVAMIGSIYYPFPSGQSLDIEGFIKFWLRELIILGGVVIAFIFAGIAWLHRRFKSRQTGRRNEP